MSSRFPALVVLVLTLTLVSVSTYGPSRAQPPKRGDVLNLMQREDLPQGFSLHETNTNSTTWPSLPYFNNLASVEAIDAPDPTTVVSTSPSGPRAQPGPAPLGLQLEPHAGGLAGPLKAAGAGASTRLDLRRGLHLRLLHVGH
ncbi:MAG: hypothetical protein HY217_09020 [Candidatus Rokubacteria bacterium]|nr:hypothetical protein [Candidatus Rokubacteria bacterium]